MQAAGLWPAEPDAYGGEWVLVTEVDGRPHHVALSVCDSDEIKIAVRSPLTVLGKIFDAQHAEDRTLISAHLSTALRGSTVFRDVKRCSRTG
jgi:hypothetical protein